MLTLWYDKIVVILIALLSSDYLKEIETHNYLIHMSLYKSIQSLNKVIDRNAKVDCKEFLEGPLWKEA